MRLLLDLNSTSKTYGSMQKFKLNVKIFTIKHDSPQDFLKLFLDFDILFIKVALKPIGELYFFAFKTRQENNFNKSYGK